MLLAVLATLSVAAQPNTTDFQVLAGREFSGLMRHAGMQCPQVPVRHLTPAGLLDVEEGFVAGLDPAHRRKLDSHLLPDRCADRNGASCPAIAGLAGFRQSGLSEAFVRYLCQPGMVR